MSEIAESKVSSAAVSGEDEARAQVYALLGSLLARAPAQEMLEALLQIDAPATEASQGMAPAWGSLKQAAGRAAAGAVADEYQELFVGVTRGELVPYASWYLTGFLMEKPLAELRHDLKRFGFEREEGVSEPEDHAAALCETMSLVVASPEIEPAMQREFFEKHIDPWMGRFFADLASARSASFYRAVGLLGERFLEVERAYLSMLV